MTITLPSLKQILLLMGDIAIALLAITLALFIRSGGAPDPVIIDLYRFASPFLVASWIAGFTIFGLYDLHNAKNGPALLDRLGRALTFNFVLTVLLFYLVPRFGITPYVTLVIIFAINGILLAGWRTLYNTILARKSKDRVLFYGWSPEAEDLARFLKENPQLGFIPAGFAADDHEAPSSAGFFPRLGSGQELPAIVSRENVSLIALSHQIQKTKTLIRALFQVVPFGLAVMEFPRFYELVQGKVPVSLISEAWFIENLIGMRRPKYDFAKRIFDLTLALILGAIALMLLPFIALAIILSTPRDILAYKRRRARPGDGIMFFRQERVGRNGGVFNFLKFRSQILGAEKMGGEKISGPRGAGYDPRAYAAGTFLRKTYLDELPQLWNVIRGEMSFVGPRPERPEFVRGLAEDIPFYRMRELVLPGMTGWAQINMENDASVSDAAEKLQYDLYYIKNRSLALDFIILLKTAMKLLQRSGR